MATALALVAQNAACSGARLSKWREPVAAASTQDRLSSGEHSAGDGQPGYAAAERLERRSAPGAHARFPPDDAAGLACVLGPL
jgi:hypothetical protein